MSGTLLEHYLADQQVCRCSEYPELAPLLLAIADCGERLARVISRRGLDTGGFAGAETTTEPGKLQPLAEMSQALFINALSAQPLNFIASEKRDGLIELDDVERLAIALDPLDGFLNIETNSPIGVVFTILAANRSSLFEIPLGELQVAAGFLMYGPQTRLVLSVGDGCRQFLLDETDRRFYEAGSVLIVPPGQREFSINAANYRYWDERIRGFIDDCIAGTGGPLGENFNMRWNGSLVAEGYRILRRGGLFLYPADSRPGHQDGRMSLLFDALPLACLIEQAAGLASDGAKRILGLRLNSLEQKVPLIFGSGDRVAEVIDYFTGEALVNSRFPLFDHRSLFRHQGI